MIEEVVEKKKDKGQHSESKVLTMFVFSSNKLKTDPLYVLQGGSVDYYTGIFQGKIKNFPALQPRFFGALQCSTITVRRSWRLN